MMKRLAVVLLLGLAGCGGGKTPAGRAEGAGLRLGGAAVMPAFAPEARIELLRGQHPQELVRIGTGGLVSGPAGGPLVWKLFADPWRKDEAWYFLQTYAPFQLTTPAGALAFRGRGRVKPSLAERRMIFEWSRRVAIEAAGGRAGPAYGLLLSWHQVGPLGDCEDLALYLTGEAVASACGWNQEIRGRLDPVHLGRVFDWFDRLRAFQSVGGQGSSEPGVQPARLVFAGHGSQTATTSEQGEIQSFAASLFAELAGSSPSENPGAPPRQRYLLPPGALHPPPQQVILQLPERPPPGPWRAPQAPGPHLPGPPTSPPRPEAHGR
jgi:hypothetical protein